MNFMTVGFPVNILICSRSPNVCCLFMLHFAHSSPCRLHYPSSLHLASLTEHRLLGLQHGLGPRPKSTRTPLGFCSLLTWNSFAVKRWIFAWFACVNHKCTGFPVNSPRSLWKSVVLSTHLPPPAQEINGAQWRGHHDDPKSASFIPSNVANLRMSHSPLTQPYYLKGN